MKLNLSAIAIVVILIVICMLYNTFSKMPGIKTQKEQFFGIGSFGKSNSNSCNNQCSPVSPDADTKGTQWCGGCYGMPALILADQGVKGNHMELNAIPVNSSGSDFSLSTSHFELFAMPNVPNVPNVPGISKKKPTAQDKKTDAGKDKASEEVKSKYKEKQKAFAEKSNKYFSKAKSIGNKINDHFFGWL